MIKSRKHSGPREPVSLETVRQMALALPGVEEGTSYGTPAFRVSGKFLARMKEDGETLVVKVDYVAREVLMGAAPATFFVTDHCRCHPMMLVRLASVDPEALRNLLEEAWRLGAPKRLVAGYDARRDRRDKR